MRPLSIADIADLRAYEREREAFRAEVIALKRLRRIGIGPIVTVVVENRTTVRFQVQEMARAEKMVRDEQILGEIEAYNQLIGGPGEISMTLFVELTEEAQLREWLPKLVGIEQAVRLQIGDGPRAAVLHASVEAGHQALLTRDEVTASVHYVKISLAPAEQRRFLTEVARLGIDHPSYEHWTELGEATKASIASDWDAECS